LCWLRPRALLSMDAISVFKNMVQVDPENKLCFECGKPHPQWASIPLAIIVCLECSGSHRSLGVQLSFVRSLTMDSWTDKQLCQMRCGGNGQAKLFFNKYNLQSNGNMTEKYSSSVAQAYRAKIKALSEQQSWQDPSSDEIARKFPPASTAKSSFSLNKSNSDSISRGPQAVGSRNQVSDRDRYQPDYARDTRDMDANSGMRNSRDYRDNREKDGNGSLKNSRDPRDRDTDGNGGIRNSRDYRDGRDGSSPGGFGNGVGAGNLPFNFEEVKATIVSTTELGWGFAQVVFNTAASYVGEGVTAVSKIAQENLDPYLYPPEEQIQPNQIRNDTQNSNQEPYQNPDAKFSQAPTSEPERDIARPKDVPVNPQPQQLYPPKKINDSFEYGLKSNTSPKPTPKAGWFDDFDEDMNVAPTKKPLSVSGGFGKDKGDSNAWEGF